MSLATFPIRAQFLFTTNNGVLTLVRYTGTDSNVVIPSTNNGYPVTSIGAGASAALRCLTPSLISGAKLSNAVSA